MPEFDIEFESEMKTCGSDSESYIDLDHYRKLVRTFIDLRRYKTALFWAEKVVALSQHNPDDVYWEAQCMFLLREYHRAAYIIKLRGLEKTHALCHYLAVESLLEAKEYPKAIELLNLVDLDTLTITSADGTTCPIIINDQQQKAEIIASICLMKGKVLEAMDNRTLAMDFYVQALQQSVYCTEALELLSQHEMLMSWEEQNLIANLPFQQQCTEAEAEILKKVYKTKLKKYYESESMGENPNQTPVSNLPSVLQQIQSTADKINNDIESDMKIGGRHSSKLFTPIQHNILAPAQKILQDIKTTPSFSIQASLSKNSFLNNDQSTKSSSDVFKPNLSTQTKTTLTMAVSRDRICHSLDILVAKSEKHFYNCEYKQCMQILDEVLKEDPYHAAGLTVLIGCLVELKESNKLFYMAHKLVDLYPDQAISWYAVGCYYDLIGKCDPARRYISKATSLDRLFGPAWLAYGHSFAKENEHDQAMAAYFKATQLMRGCHLPLLYIGVECGLTKNLELAEKFFYQAMAIAPLDVFVLHELGVIKFEYEFFESAEEIFRTTLDMVTKMSKQNKKPISPRWEPLLNNLGHCCRKNKKYSEALNFHQRALVLKPQSASTYTCIGFVQALMGHLEDAIESLHRSLAIKRDDIVTSALLKFCIEELMEENMLPDNILEVDIPDEMLLPADAGKHEKLLSKDITPATIVETSSKTKYDESNLSTNSDVEDMSSDMSMDV